VSFVSLLPGEKKQVNELTHSPFTRERAEPLTLSSIPFPSTIGCSYVSMSTAILTSVLFLHFHHAYSFFLEKKNRRNFFLKLFISAMCCDP